MKVGGLLGKAGWAFIHVLYLGRAEGQLMFVLCRDSLACSSEGPVRATSILRPLSRQWPRLERRGLANCTCKR